MKNVPKAGDLLPTPRAMEIAEDPDKFVARNGDRQNSMPNLASMAKYEMLPTPITRDWKGMEGRNYKAIKEGKQPTNTLPAVVNGLLPTPTAIEGVKLTNTWNPNSQMGQSLSAMAGSGMLPTPRTGYSQRCMDNEKLAEREKGNLEEAVAKAWQSDKESQEKAGGKTSRLSPLFTEEMMGFPLMWTALPFLSENGEPKPSKPTATPSSPK
jgi:hypothetical protein